MVQHDKMQIEAVHVFNYHKSISPVILRAFQPRVVISGFIFQETEVLDDGTKLIFINAMGFVREGYQVLTVIGSMAIGNRWPTGPPTPKLYSPVHITGFFDCIDNFSLTPVIIIEELTLEVGNKRVTELINQARIEGKFSKFHRTEHSASRQAFETNVDFDFSWGYAESRASLASIPAFHTPYPTPFPLDRSAFWYPEREEPQYPAPHYPIHVNKGVFGANNEAHLQVETNHNTHDGDSSSQLPKDKAASDRTISDGEASRPDSEGQKAHETPPPCDDAIIRHDTIYMQDILPPGERDMPSRPKRNAPQTPPITPHRSSPRKRAKSLPSSQTMLQTWMGNSIKH
ncbi:hypothetical protein M422DRAFT_275925 [Sphaerobolus stellatus SS14]|uniref:Uncharacterized protein n=1 Tax=Sphaerobolus stellatus (strain SS14) TaxID=990650 RepID=A0A0C9TNN0_SPHS4|nr:hypothetical protein M422DRAFT_275925 [Sphaerobolus stellatus SS14]